MKLPIEYIDDTFGVKPGKDQDSFNNIVYAAWYHLARAEKGTFSETDHDSLVAHLALNNDEHGLYKPKNSHDNISYKIILNEVFKLKFDKKMSYFRAILDIGLFRIWDVILYWFIFGPKGFRWMARPFLFIVGLQMIEAAYKKDKIRPKIFDAKDPANQRFPWWYLPKKQVGKGEGLGGVYIYKYWKDYRGNERTTRHMQNDGKHLLIFKLYAFQHKSLTLRITAKICRKILTSRYGTDYTYGVLNRYFLDREHPVPPMWKNTGDILE